MKSYTKHRIQGRANPYGLCPCARCRAGRNKRKFDIETIKHKYRFAWKGGRPEAKGLYTD